MPASNLRVTVLGPVLVEGRTGRLVEPGGRLATALVTILVLANGRAVSTAALIDELWDDAPPTGAKAALQTLVSRVRAVSAPGLIESSAAGYRLALGPEETDLGAAATMSDAASSAVRSGDAYVAGALAQQALDLWAGEPGAALDDRIADELGRRAERLRDELRRVRAQSRIELGEGAAVIADLEALSAADPLDDATHLMLFNAYAQSGRRADAMGLFADYRARLRDRLGADPASALVAAHTSLLQDDSAGGHATSTVPSPEGSGRLVSGLRTAPNELIGRDADIEAIRSLIGSTRMTTILGPGGLGKTRVAQEIARQATASTPGVVFVELASIRDAADLPLAVATALGIREAPSARRLSEALTAHPVELHDRIIAALAERPTLLVMDNCEHLVDAAARWIADALDWTRELRILATSRSPLSIAAEHVYRLDPLPAGDATLLEDAGPAVRLFVERARAARPDAHIPLAVAARLCARLDGLPLAIELAAARTRSMSVDEVERRLGNRFALLTAGDRSAPERHQTLLAVIDWSWNLLGERERVVLRRTSRFPDGFGIDAATAVADEIDDVPEALDALVGQSLLTVRDDPATGTLRFRMLETVREFGMLALDEAGEGGRVLESTRAWVIGLASAQLPSMHGPEQLSAFATLALEQDTLVGVLRGGIAEERPDVVASVFAGLAVFWTIRSAHQEVLVFGEAVLDVLRRQDPRTVTDDATAVSCAVIAVTFLSTDFRTSARAIGALRRVERERVTQHPRMRALVELMLSAGREERALELMQEYRNAPDPQVANVGNLLAAQMAENSGDPRSAEAAALRANELSHAIGDVWGAAMSAHMLAQLHSQNAEPTEALRWASDAATGLRAVGADADLRQLDWLVALGDIARGEFTAATDVLERFLGDDVADSAFAPIPERRSIVWAGLAEVARAQGDLRRGAELYDLALGSFAAAESRRSPWFALVTAAALAAAVLDDTHEDAWLGRIARRLRTRTVALGRLLPNRFDRPVLGSGVLALGSWYARSEDPAVRSAGVELMALAARLASRQDIPSLVRAQHERAVADRSTAPDLERRAAEVAALSVDESAARALELLSSKALAAR